MISFLQDWWLLLLVLFLCVAGMVMSVHQEVDENVDQFRYATFDGHEYVIYQRGFGPGKMAGIAHSPKCPCRNKEDAP